MLLPEIQTQILAMHFSQNLSIRAIARKLRINRKTVVAAIRRRAVLLKPSPSTIPRSSLLDKYKPIIAEKLLRDPTVPASAIYQSLRRLGYPGSLRLVRYYIAQNREVPRSREAFLKLSFEPGQTAQVDWGEFGDVFGDGGKIHAFVMVLCYSRKLYVEFTRSERFEDFLRCHEHAFQFFKGRTAELWYDNLASAVTERVGKLVKFNARFHAYCGHHGFHPYACNPASGNEKGRVEDGVKYIRSSFWADRRFRDFDDLQSQCKEWLDGIANVREHRSTKRIPDLMFEAEERTHLQKASPHPYDTDEVISKNVSPQFHLTYETNQYSVPWTLVGLVVTLRIDQNTVRAYYRDRLVAGHDRHYGKHRVFTKPEHQEGLQERKPGADHHSWQVAFVKNAGDSLARYLKLISAGQRSLRSEIRRLVALITVYGADAINTAAEDCLKRGIVGVDNLERLVKGQGTPLINPEPVQFQNSRLNRITSIPDLRQYDALLLQDNDETENDK